MVYVDIRGLGTTLLAQYCYNSRTSVSIEIVADAADGIVSASHTL